MSKTSWAVLADGATRCITAEGYFFSEVFRGRNWDPSKYADAGILLLVSPFMILLFLLGEL